MSVTGVIHLTEVRTQLYKILNESAHFSMVTQRGAEWLRVCKLGTSKLDIDVTVLLLWTGAGG